MKARTLFQIVERRMRFTAHEFAVFRQICTTPDAYWHFLNQTYFYIRETVPSLRAVANVSIDHPLLQFIHEKVRDEDGHEILALNDMRTIGETTPSGPYSPHLHGLVDRLRGFATEPDPISAVLGDVLARECFPPTVTGVRQFLSRAGVTEQAGSLLFAHVELDEGHRARAIEVLEHDSVDLSVVLDTADMINENFGKHWRWMYQRLACSGTPQ